MSPDKTHHIVLITGANRGLGLEIAKQLTRRGFQVVIAARNEDSDRKAARQLAPSPITWMSSSTTPASIPTRARRS